MSPAAHDVAAGDRVKVAAWYRAHARAWMVAGDGAQFMTDLVALLGEVRAEGQPRTVAPD